MPGSQFCKAHGAPLANTNAVKHGFYRNVITEEYASLLVYAEQFDLADELALTKLRLNDIVAYINEHRPRSHRRLHVGTGPCACPCL